MIKRINVMNGQISLRVPEDIPALMATLDDICEKLASYAGKLTSKNEARVDGEFRKYAAKRFENFWGKGSCEKVFGTNLPGYKAYADFTEQIVKLIGEWIEIPERNG